MGLSAPRQRQWQSPVGRIFASGRAAHPQKSPSRVPAMGFAPGQTNPTNPSNSTQAPQPSGQAGQAEPSFSEDLSPALFALGLSFVAAFCVAYALRAALKLALIAIGLGVLAVLALNHTGMISINWSVAQGWYGQLGPWLSQQTASLRQFVTGYLPSSASATAGLVAGFTRK